MTLYHHHPMVKPASDYVAMALRVPTKLYAELQKELGRRRKDTPEVNMSDVVRDLLRKALP